MKGLAVNRTLDGETFKKNVVYNGKEYALHVTHNGEYVLTDKKEYDEIFCIMSYCFVHPGETTR